MASPQDGGTRTVLLARFAMVLAVLGLVAVLAPLPQPSDRELLESIGRHPYAPNCADVHCFRAVVPWIMEQIPGDALVKWRVYAVLFNAGAAFAVGWLSPILGLSSKAVPAAVWLSALGAGGLATIYHPYTADPVMFLLGPLAVGLLLRDRIRLVGVIAGAGIFVKEFAAAPLWIFTLYAWLARDRARWRSFGAALAVTLLWLTLQLVLILGYHNSYADNPSTHLFAGGALRPWFESLGARKAAAAVIGAFGPLYLLMAAALPTAPRQVRLLALAALPAVLAFVYVETPERALWNFSFLVISIAARMLTELPRPLMWLFVAAYGLANARIGAEIMIVPASRYALLVSGIVALPIVLGVWKARS